MATKTNPNIWVCAYDVHYPKTDPKVFAAMLQFIESNKDKIAGFYFGGDQLDNAEISRHNAGKPLFKPTGAYKRNTEGFDRDILSPIERALPDNAERVWQIGNHDDWEDQLVQASPELMGTVERPQLLNLDERGWKVICCGGGMKLGKLTLIHGETLSGIGNQASAYHAKRAVENYGGSVLYGHMHSPQSYTKVLPHDQTAKWQAYCAPILGAINPGYLRNRPTAWLNGFVIVEVMEQGLFNVYQIVVSKGKFSFGGVAYGGKQ